MAVFSIASSSDEVSSPEEDAELDEDDEESSPRVSKVSERRWAYRRVSRGLPIASRSVKRGITGNGEVTLASR